MKTCLQGVTYFKTMISNVILKTDLTCNHEEKFYSVLVALLPKATSLYLPVTNHNTKLF